MELSFVGGGYLFFMPPARILPRNPSLGTPVPVLPDPRPGGGPLLPRGIMMKAEVKIPKGWRRVKKGNLRLHDRFFDGEDLWWYPVESDMDPPFDSAPVDCYAIVIRKVKP